MSGACLCSLNKAFIIITLSVVLVHECTPLMSPVVELEHSNARLMSAVMAQECACQISALALHGCTYLMTATVILELVRLKWVDGLYTPDINTLVFQTLVTSTEGLLHVYV